MPPKDNKMPRYSTCLSTGKRTPEPTSSYVMQSPTSSQPNYVVWWFEYYTVVPETVRTFRYYEHAEAYVEQLEAQHKK